MTAFTEFANAVHELWREAGQPTMRQIAAATNGSVPKTTVHAMLTGANLPTWETASAVVTALGGDPDAYLALWTAARPPARARPRVDRLAPVDDVTLIAEAIRDGLGGIASAIRELARATDNGGL